jgi:hypothetical protein
LKIIKDGCPLDYIHLFAISTWLVYENSMNHKLRSTVLFSRAIRKYIINDRIKNVSAISSTETVWIYSFWILDSRCPTIEEIKIWNAFHYWLNPCKISHGSHLTRKLSQKWTHKPAIIVLLKGYLLIQSEYRFSFYFVTFDLFSKSRTNTTQVKAPMVIRSFDKLMIFSSVDTFRAPRQ